MFVDAHSVTDGKQIECDLCVIGAGTAGITFAHEFAGRSERVCVIESGDFELDPATQALYEGESVGLPYVPLDVSRLRYFGGTMNHWGGQCLRLAESDFEQRPWLPYSGWPIDLATVAPYYERARVMLGLPEDGWDLAKWEERSGFTRLPFDPARFVTDAFLTVPVHFGETLRQTLADAPNVDVYLNANVVEIETNESASLATAVRLRTLTEKHLLVRARRFVLAAGGIENPRLLLLSNKVMKPGLGNQNDVVGRFFLEHPHFPAAVLYPASPGIPVWFYEPEPGPPPRMNPLLLVVDDAQRDAQLTPVAVGLEPVADASYQSEGYQSLRNISRLRRGQLPDDLAGDIGSVLSDIGDLAGLAFRRIRYGQPPVSQVDCRVTITPAPNPDSRITLSELRDALGQRRVRLDWRLSEIDKRSAKHAVALLGAEVGRLGLGRLKSVLDDDALWPESLDIAHHHVGTTRMADNPKHGVVDRNCKVHGIENLYVAGSSVFPTVGVGTPTFLIVALTIRLADHIAELP